MQKLNATALGLAAGIVWALFLFVFIIISMYANWGGAWVDLMGSIYMGVGSSWSGALLALPWAFVDAFIGAFIIGWLYNKFV